MAKKFFHVCAGLFLPALGSHLGAQGASAQAPGNPVVGCGVAAYGGSYATVAVTANGDFYSMTSSGTPQFRGNIFGAATPAQSASWGQMKSTYRK